MIYIILLAGLLTLYFIYHYKSIDINNNTVADSYDIFTDIFYPLRTDITCAFYDGDFSLSLEQAQQKKYEKIFNFLQFKPGDTVLDIGCGWGYFVEEVNRRGGKGIGITLSKKQAAAGQKRRLDLRVINWKDIDPKTFGKVDHIVSIDAFEHFASPNEVYNLKIHDKIYEKYFELCYNLLKDNGRCYLQTMSFTRKGEEVANRVIFDIKTALGCPKWSDDFIFALLSYFYPDSILPMGLDQIRRTSLKYFHIEEQNSGRKDYIVTMTEWGKRMDNLPWNYKLWLYMKYFPLMLFHKKLYYSYLSFKNSANQEAFKRELFEHERIYFVKNPHGL